jgi:O-antigen ligase
MNTKTNARFLTSYLFLWFSVLFLGLLYSGTLQIIAMAMLFLPTFIRLETGPVAIRWNKDLAERLRLFWEKKQFLAITLVFWVSFFSFLNSDNLEKWWFFTSMKIPFLLFTFAVFNLPAFERKTFHRLLLLFALIIVFSSFRVIGPILDQPDTWKAIILQGQSIPTPMDHIKYSLFISFAIMAGLIVLLSREVLFFRGEKILFGSLLLYLFIFLHLLAVRSGIVILYVNLGVYILHILARRKQYLLGSAALLILLSMPVGAYFSLPTFRAKVDYSIRDFQMSRQNREMAYSDGERLRSYRVGIDIFESSPVTGVGVGDLFREYAIRYQLKYFVKNPTNLPHNQFLSVAAGTGVIGLILFAIAFFFPFACCNAWRDPFLRALFILMFLSFLVENTLERQYSVGFYLTFLLLGMKQFYRDRDSQPGR